MTADRATVVPRPAATVVLFRDGPAGAQLLLTRRPSTMAFGPDLHVFPGGAVEPADEARAGTTTADDPWAVARIAAVREMHEEAGIELDPAALVPMSLWTTPPIMPRRYATRFFAAWLPPGAEPRFDPGEVVDHAWLRPTDALAHMAAGEIQLWIPTSSTLQLVEGVARLDDVRARVVQRIQPAPPTLERRDPLPSVIRATGAGGVAGHAAIGWLVGRERLVLVDHGDPAEDVADLILEAVVDRGARLDAIVLTSLAPEHSGGAEALALRADVPILTARAAGRRLPHATIALDDGDHIPFGDVDLEARLVDDGSRMTLHTTAGLRLPEPPA